MDVRWVGFRPLRSSFFKKLSALAIVAVLATLGDKIQIRTFLFVLCCLRKPRQGL
jgi:hypothetical protein